MQINAGANVQTIGAQFVAGNNVEINSPKFSALSLLTPTMVLRPSGLVGLFNGRDGWFGYGYDGGLVGSFYGSFAVNADDIQIEGVAVNAALWPAAGFVDTELRCSRLKPEHRHAKTEVQQRIQT